MTAAASPRDFAHRPPVKTLSRACLEATNSPWEALELAIDITWWRMIADLQVIPRDDEALPLPVRRARDAEIERREAVR